MLDVRDIGVPVAALAAFFAALASTFACSLASFNMTPLGNGCSSFFFHFVIYLSISSFHFTVRINVVYDNFFLELVSSSHAKHRFIEVGVLCFHVCSCWQIQNPVRIPRISAHRANSFCNWKLSFTNFALLFNYQVPKFNDIFNR